MSLELHERLADDDDEQYECHATSVDRGEGHAAVIGSGRLGHCDGAAHRAAMHRPYGICTFGQGGATALVFTDCYNNAIRLVVNADHPTTSRVCTIENSGLLKPKGLCVSDDHRYLFVCDTGHHRIKFAALPPSRSAFETNDGASRSSEYLARNVEVFSFAGSGEKTWKDGPVQQAGFNSPGGVWECSDGTIVVADTGNHCIRAIRRSMRLGGGLVVATIAGGMRTQTQLPSGQSRAGHRDGDGCDALFRSPSAIIEGPFGELLVADTMNHCIRALVPTTGSNAERWTVSTVCGRPQRSGYIDGSCSTALFCKPVALSRGPNKTIFVSDAGNKCIRQFGSSGVLSSRPTARTHLPYTWVRSIDSDGGVIRPVFQRQARAEDRVVLGITYTTDGGLWLCNSAGNVIEHVPVSKDTMKEPRIHQKIQRSMSSATLGGNTAMSDNSVSDNSSICSGYTASSSASASEESSSSSPYKFPRDTDSLKVRGRSARTDALGRQNATLRQQNTSLCRLLEKTLAEIASVTNSVTDVRSSTPTHERRRREALRPVRSSIALRSTLRTGVE